MDLIMKLLLTILFALGASDPLWERDPDDCWVTVPLSIVMVAGIWLWL